MTVLPRQLPSTSMTGPRIVWCSDTHLGHNQPIRGAERPDDRGADFFGNFQRVINHAIAAGAGALVHTGDFFFRSKVHAAIVDRAYGMLLAAAEHMHVVILPGNHERSVLPPSLFLHHPQLHILAQPRTVTLGLQGLPVAFTGFPFERGIRLRFADLLAAANPAPTATTRYLCLHQSIEGATVGPAGYTFRATDPEVIPINAIPAGYTGVLCGHIHRHQVLDAASPVLFCGSTERTSFAEAAETKGFCELWPKTAAARFVPLPTRPMVTYNAASDGTFKGWLNSQSPRAIVRVRIDDDGMDRRVRKLLGPSQVLAASFQQMQGDSRSTRRPSLRTR